MTDPEETPSLRERKKLEKLASIRAAARELFATHGYEKTTTRAISERAGIGAGTLFSYFPDKQSLLVHLFVTEIGAAAAAAVARAESRDAPLLERLMGAFTDLYAYYARDEALSRVVVQQMLFLAPGNQRAHEGMSLGFVARLARLVDDAGRRGELPPDTPGMLVATAAFAQYFFVLISWLGASLKPTARDAVLRQLLERVVPTDA